MMMRRSSPGDGDANDECVLVTSRRVIVIADDAQLSCDFGG